MAVYGNNALPGSGFFHDDSGNSQYCSEFGSWPGGIVNDINIYVAGDGASVVVQYAIWDHGNHLLWSSAGHSIGSGTQTIHGQAWQSNGVGIYIAPTTSLKLGFQTDDHVVWTFESTGTVQFNRGVTGPQDFVVDGTESSGGSFGAYIDYTPISVPNVTGVSPSVGTTGTSLSITGSGFTGTTGVTINGASASFTVVDDGHITATVPAGATPGTGTIVVTNPAGSGSIAFTVGQVKYGTGTGAASIKAVWYGKDMGGGVITPTKIVGVWVPVGSPPTGVKRIW